MNKVFTALAITGALVLGGCATTDPYKNAIEDQAKEYQNSKYDLAKTLACSVNIRTLLDDYVTNPKGVKGLVEWCGYGDLLRAYSDSEYGD